MTTKTAIAVLRGGPSAEHEVSLKSGLNVLDCLPKDTYEAHDILITKAGIWTRLGVPLEPKEALRGIDLVFNALHGEYGEDGAVQKLIDDLGIPYTGSGADASALAMQKTKAKEVFAAAGLRIAKGISVAKEGAWKNQIEAFSQNTAGPWIVKPDARGSSVGLAVAPDREALATAVQKAFHYDANVLIEQYIAGREATCAVLENFEGRALAALPVIEIIPPAGKLFDYETKYDGSTKEICPGNFSKETTDEIQRMAAIAHSALGCIDYSRSDFIVSNNGVFILETNTLPGLTSESLLPKAAAAANLLFPQLLDHLAKNALGRSTSR